MGFSFDQLTDQQKIYLDNVTKLIGFNLVLFVIIVQGLHWFFPNRLYIFTGNHPLDSFIYLLASLILILSIQSYPWDYASETQLKVRTGLFFIFCSFLAYIFGIGYNILMTLSKKDSEKAKNIQKFFFISIGCAIVLMSLIISALPYLLQYIADMKILAVLLSIVLFGLLIWRLLSSKIEYQYLIVGTLTFLLYLVVDTVLQVDRCKTPNTQECDPPTGALTIYLDLINFIQYVFTTLVKRDNEIE